jgi:hypothetical protein
MNSINRDWNEIKMSFWGIGTSGVNSGLFQYRELPFRVMAIMVNTRIPEIHSCELVEKINEVSISFILNSYFAKTTYVRNRNLFNMLEKPA